MKRFSSRTSGRSSSSGGANPSSISSRASDCTSATMATVSATVLCTSRIRTSTVPNRGWGRTSHQRKVGSSNALQRSSTSTASTQSA